VDLPCGGVGGHRRPTLGARFGCPGLHSWYRRRTLRAASHQGLQVVGPSRKRRATGAAFGTGLAAIPTTSLQPPVRIGPLPTLRASR
jgi:hypothetical protein